MATQVNVQPGHGKGGRQPTRQFLDSLSGHDDPGMFGRMFPNLEPLAVDDASAEGTCRRDEGCQSGRRRAATTPKSRRGSPISASSSITTSRSISPRSATRKPIPTAIENFRTPALDLDSVYGLGPDGSRQLYARNPGDTDGKTPGPKLLIGKTISVDDVIITPRNDLPRNPEGFALIGDHRNDENLVVAQTHLAMLKFHNKVCDHLAASGVPTGELFAQARQMVTWHYQWMVLHDFVERITEKGNRRQDSRPGAPLLPLQEDALHAGRVLRGGLPVRPQHGARGLQPQSQVHAGRRHSGHAQSAVQVHRPVGRNHRRPRARSGAAAAADSGAFQQLDHRLASLLRGAGGQSPRCAAQSLAQGRSVPDTPTARSARAAAAACRSAI